MNRFTTQLGITAFSVLTLSGLMIGCSHQTEGQKTQEQANGMNNAADMILTGERHVADGKAEITRGQTMKDQGDATEGDRQIAEGKVLQSQGEGEIAQGRKLKDTAKQ